MEPDGARIATGSDDKTARVWDAATGANVAALKGHTAEVVSAAWSPDGTRIATSARDRNARVWDAATGRCLTLHRVHARWVDVVAWSPDGARIATGSDDNTARLWTVDPGYVRDRLWEATPYCLSVSRRMELLDEDEITAEGNARAHRDEEARRRAARPSLALAVVAPDREEQRRWWATPAVNPAPGASGEDGAPATPAVDPAPGASGEDGAPAALAPQDSVSAQPVSGSAAPPATAGAEMTMVLGELRALFQGAEQKIGELMGRLSTRVPPEE